MIDETALTLLVGAIYEAVLEPGGWAHVLQRMGDLFGGAAGMLTVHKFPEGVRFATSARLDLGLQPLFDAEYSGPRRNPSVALLLRQPVGMPVIGSKFHDRREFYRSEIYDVFHRPQGLQDGAAALLLREPDHCAMWGLMQPEGAEPLAAEDEPLLLVLASHLQRAVQLMLRLDVLRARADAAEEALDRLPIGVILVDAAGRPLRLNRVAEHIVAGGDGLQARRDGLVAARPDETRALHRLIAAASATGAGRGLASGGALALSRPSGSLPLSLLIAPCRGERLVHGRDRPAALVFVSDPEREAATPPELLRRLYGLTRAEAGLAALLLQGRDLPEAGAELGVSPHTARAHLKAVLAKTGTARQAELVRILLRGPAGLLPD